MQDRIKFRIWDKSIGEMAYDTIIKIFDSCPEVNSICANTSCGQITYCGNKLKDIEIMQCTGLKDKHGKLIYEGDFLRYPPKEKNEETNFVACEVFFHNNDCCDTHIGFQMNRFRFLGNLRGIINYGSKYNFIPKNVEKMEVIGNIYENPELLSEVE